MIVSGESNMALTKYQVRRLIVEIERGNLRKNKPRKSLGDVIYDDIPKAIYEDIPDAVDGFFDNLLGLR